jgi:predicted helicase
VPQEPSASSLAPSGIPGPGSINTATPVSIHSILEWIRATSLTTQEVGSRFERLMLAFFRTDRTYAAQFRRVWLWAEWPGNEGKVDTGIDLVAENAFDDGFTAIQCKCYAPTTTLDKSDIDSFFTASGKAPFTNRIIVATTDAWSKHAEDALHGQDKPVQRLGLDGLESSTVDWSQWDPTNHELLTLRPRKAPRPHQVEAIEAAVRNYADESRGRLIMACGTGKTYTAQRIAESLVGPGGKVLVLLPSISLLSQTLKEWTADASVPIAPFAVCSDTRAGQRDNSEDISPFDLVLPATTDPAAIVHQMERTSNGDVMSVVFSTYQSLPVVAAAQRAGVGKFDLVIADEAHRTTGVTTAGSDASAFTQVHDDAYLVTARRLYMTATPRVFSDTAKGKASAVDAVLASMDDASIYGPEFHRLGFHEAVQRDLLTDYKVLILAIDEAAVSRAFQQQLSDENNELRLDDATRIVGCLNALSKRDHGSHSFADDPDPMQRAVAFSNTIARSKKFLTQFTEIAEQWRDSERGQRFEAEVQHVDGRLNSLQREGLLRWLKDGGPQGECRVLTNARCLTEGVDVPALDAILFLEPRNSMVDVVQAVGRVMRKAGADKKFGYVVLPVGIPAGQTSEEALADNKRFRAVWQVLNALRSHDERMNAVINKLELNDEPPSIVEVIGISDPIFDDDGDETGAAPAADAARPAFPLEEIREGIYARLVERVGTRHYWEDWARDVAEIAERQRARITTLITDPALGLQKEFQHFVEGLHAILNDSITEDDAVTMLSQHLITKPIFDALFTEFEFAESNAVSRVMQTMVDHLSRHSLDKESEPLEGFYESVRLRVEGIDNAAGKQRIITELYEGFFSKAFPKAAESLGVVYTPVEIIDYLLFAADHALRRHFDGACLSDPGVQILDPFLGTGTSLVRLLQIGLIRPDDLARKYAQELHGNELLLLAYYIAAVNIEATYHDVRLESGGPSPYEPFAGAVLADTFQLSEAANEVGAFDVFPVNNERAAHQKAIDVRVILGNPPYSIGQVTQNDANQNLAYPHLDATITDSYAKLSASRSKRSLYDSYVRALRWATNRILEPDTGGIIAFVTNGGFIDNTAFDGFRRSVAQTFHHIYVLNLRGNQRTAKEESRREGGKVFGAGSRATVAITVLVREDGPLPAGGGAIHYHDIGDYLSREQKLEIVAGAANSEALDAFPWTDIQPNEQADWINQRSVEFLQYPPLFDPAQGDSATLFRTRNLGLASNRDAWNYNSSRARVVAAADRMVAAYNKEVDAFERAHPRLGKESSAARTALVKKYLTYDAKEFSWTRSDYGRVAAGERYAFDPADVAVAMYRPFFKQFVNANRRLNAVPGRLPDAFLAHGSSARAICVSGSGQFGAFMVDVLPDLNMLSGGAYAFLEYTPPSSTPEDSGTLFQFVESPAQSNVTERACLQFSEALGFAVEVVDIFHYVYGVLHMSDYRATYASELAKEMPRIPVPGSVDAFRRVADAGAVLSDLHLGYETVDPWSDLEITGYDIGSGTPCIVEKMRYGRSSAGGVDRSTVVVNSAVTISGIPPTAHDYLIGSRSAIDWVVDRYRQTVDKDSGIRNDPNEWGLEHGDPAYIPKLLCRIVTVSMRTQEVCSAMPRLGDLLAR